MDLSEEDKQQIKEWKANERRKKAYSKQIIKERKEYQSKLIELEREGEALEEEITEEIKIETPKKRLYKAYYKCQTCNNSFNTLTILHKHLMLIKGCSFLSDTTQEVDKLLTRNMETLELKINSYKMDLEASTEDFTTKKKRLNSMKDTIFKIETLFKNQSHLYEESKRVILKEYISEYKDDVKKLLLEYYRIIEKADLFDL
jgi:hypothetical protein